MRWYFLRHAETAANIGRVYNPDGDELTATGKEQALRARDYVHSLAVDTVFCSPLQRAQETAQLLNVHPVIVPELTDRNFGSFAGKPYGSLRAYCAEHGVDMGRFAPPGGESYKDVESRVLRFIHALPEGDYLFISHAGVIMQVLREVSGEPWSSLMVDNLALWVVEDGRITMRNERPWENDK